MHIDGADHGAADPQSPQAGQESRYQRKSATEFGYGSKRLKNSGDRRCWPHPTQGILDLPPSVKHECITDDQPDEENDQINFDRLIAYGENL